MRSLVCWDCRFESRAGGHGNLFLLSVVCCKVEASASGWSLVQRSHTECGVCLRVIAKTCKARPWPEIGFKHHKKTKKKKTITKGKAGENISLICPFPWLIIYPISVRFLGSYLTWLRPSARAGSGLTMIWESWQVYTWRGLTSYLLWFSSVASKYQV